MLAFLLFGMFLSILSTGLHSFRRLSPGLLRFGKATVMPLAMAMELRTLHFPVQSDYSQYSQLLRDKINEDKIVRWYVSSMNCSVATVEVVVEDSGVGKSRMSA